MSKPGPTLRQRKALRSAAATKGWVTRRTRRDLKREVAEVIGSHRNDGVRGAWRAVLDWLRR